MPDAYVTINGPSGSTVVPILDPDTTSTYVTWSNLPDAEFVFVNVHGGDFYAYPTSFETDPFGPDHADDLYVQYTQPTDPGHVVFKPRDGLPTRFQIDYYYGSGISSVTVSWGVIGNIDVEYYGPEIVADPLYPAFGLLGPTTEATEGRTSTYTEDRSVGDGGYSAGMDCLIAKAYEGHDWGFTDADGAFAGHPSGSLCGAGAGDGTTSQPTAAEGAYVEYNTAFGFMHTEADPVDASDIVEVSVQWATVRSVAVRIVAPDRDYFDHPVPTRYGVVDYYVRTGEPYQWVGVGERVISDFHLTIRAEPYNTNARSGVGSASPEPTTLKVFDANSSGLVTVGAGEAVTYNALATPAELSALPEVAEFAIPLGSSSEGTDYVVPLDYDSFVAGPDYNFAGTLGTVPARYAKFIIATTQNESGATFTVPPPEAHFFSVGTHREGVLLGGIDGFIPYLDTISPRWRRGRYVEKPGGWHVGVQGIGPPAWG